MKPRSNRIFFYIIAAINMTAYIVYCTIGSNHGWTPIDIEFLHSAGIVSRIDSEIFFTRYVD